MTLRALSDSLAVRIVLAVGTMECALAFLFFGLLPLVWPQSERLVQFISSSLLQLVLLPVIMVGQDLMSRKAEARAEADHQAIMQELALVKRLQEEMAELLRALGLEVPCAVD